MSQKSNDGSVTLYLIPTPIGNYDDITLRGLELLKQLDVLFCEDTRETSLLLSHYQIKKKLIASHQFNEEKNEEKLISYLEAGVSIGIVSDQGTPIISDPGYLLAKCAIDHGYNVVGLPGATAFVPALIMSGLPPHPFLFYGFLNSKDSKRKAELEELKHESHTMIFYEAPHRIEKCLKDMFSIFNEREIAIAREISKKYEEIYRGKLSTFASQTIDMKGQLVIIVGGRKQEETSSNLTLNEQVDQIVSLGIPLKEAIKEVAKIRHMSKSEVYNSYHKEV